MLKKALCLIFAFLFSINSFAAVVSDDDGSAFITKAEFEVLKQNFADQIEQYNESIDSKIDGAIASYLAGIQLEKEEEIDCLLDKNGYYNEQFYIYWNGQTNHIRVSEAHHYALYDLFFSVVDWVRGTSPNYNDDELWGGQFEGKNFYDNTSDSTLDPYNVAKLYKVKLPDSSYEYRIKYELVKNHMKFNLFFQFPAYNWHLNTATGTVNNGELANLLVLNASNLTQNNLNNNLMTYFRRYDSSVDQVVGSVWKQCYATLTQTESDTNDIVLFPFSTSYEKVWDPEDNTTLLDYSSWNQGYSELPRVGTPTAVPGYMSVGTTGATAWGLWSPKRIDVPWQLLTDTMQIKKRKIQNLIAEDSMNSCAEEGLVIGHIPEYNKEMSLKVEGTCETAGTMYVYVGKSRIANWEATDFKGKKTSVTANTKWTLEVDNVKKNETVWIMFKNNNATTNGRVKINTFAIKS